MSRKPDILKAAIELFAAKGYHATSTHEIAEKAELSEGIIFYYFKTKEHIMLGILEDVFEEYLSGIYDAMERVETGWEAVKAFVLFHFKMRAERTKDILCLARDFPSSLTDSNSPHRTAVNHYFHKLLALISGAVERGQKDGTIRPCPVEETAFMIICTLASMPKFDIVDVTPGPDILPAALDFVHHALAPTP